MAPADFDEMRRGCWDIDARIDDMDLAGIEASVCFPSLIAGFSGLGVLARRRTPTSAWPACEAWNDWHHEVWAGTHPGPHHPHPDHLAARPRGRRRHGAGQRRAGLPGPQLRRVPGQARAAVAAHRPLGPAARRLRGDPDRRVPPHRLVVVDAAAVRRPAVRAASRRCSRSTPTSPPPTGCGRACAPGSPACRSPCPRAGSAG